MDDSKNTETLQPLARALEWEQHSDWGTTWPKCGRKKESHLAPGRRTALNTKPSAYPGSLNCTLEHRDGDKIDSLTHIVYTGTASVWMVDVLWSHARNKVSVRFVKSWDFWTTEETPVLLWLVQRGVEKITGPQTMWWCVKMTPSLISQFRPFRFRDYFGPPAGWAGREQSYNPMERARLDFGSTRLFKAPVEQPQTVLIIQNPQ